MIDISSIIFEFSDFIDCPLKHNGVTRRSFRDGLACEKLAEAIRKEIIEKVEGMTRVLMIHKEPNLDYYRDSIYNDALQDVLNLFNNKENN